MLILQRKAGQRIMIGHDIAITVLSARNGTTRLGIAAPSNIEVHREEIYKRIEADKINKINKEDYEKELAEQEGENEIEEEE